MDRNVLQTTTGRGSIRLHCGIMTKLGQWRLPLRFSGPTQSRGDRVRSTTDNRLWVRREGTRSRKRSTSVSVPHKALHRAGVEGTAFSWPHSIVLWKLVSERPEWTSSFQNQFTVFGSRSLLFISEGAMELLLVPRLQQPSPKLQPPACAF
jgi:hypothetical protein